MMKKRVRNDDKRSSNNRIRNCFLRLMGMALVCNLLWIKEILMRGILYREEEFLDGIAQWESFVNSSSKQKGEVSTGASSVPDFILPFESTLANSDFVELDHCDLSSLNWKAFRAFVDPVIQSNLPKRIIANDTALQTKLVHEWTLELLELYLTHTSKCRFDQYRPTIRNRASLQTAGFKLQQISKLPTPPNQVRTVFSIVAYKDAKHLRRLIEAIHLPHHLIIIHLEQTQIDKTYYSQVQAIADDFQNVVIVQFGTIVYKTDSISRVTLQLMYWVTNELNITYDYFASLGGAVYPLYGALELSKHLYQSRGTVWLGEATMKGRRVETPQTHLLWKHRLLATSTKLAIRTGTLFHDKVPEWMTEKMRHKSNSGNQAIFGYSTIQQMLQSQEAMQIFAMAKYSCCCCVEERTWIAAMDVIGLLEEARNQSNMFQLWGGEDGKCVGSMNNAVLDLNEKRCYRIEAPGQTEMYFWGNQTWANLVQAKQQNGLMFARKFSSERHDSVQLLNKIRKELHVT